MFRFSALPKRWISVTAPVCALGLPSFFDQVRGDNAVDDAEHLTHDGRAARELEP